MSGVFSYLYGLNILLNYAMRHIDALKNKRLQLIKVYLIKVISRINFSSLIVRILGNVEVICCD